MLLALDAPIWTVIDSAVSAVKSHVAVAGVIWPPAVIGDTAGAPVAEPIVGAVAPKTLHSPLPMNVPLDPLDRTCS